MGSVNNAMSWLTEIPAMLAMIARQPLAAVGGAAALIAAAATLFQRLTGVK